MPAPAADAPDALSHLIPSRVARGFFLAVVSGLLFNFLNGAVSGELIALIAMLLIVSTLAISR